MVLKDWQGLTIDDVTCQRCQESYDYRWAQLQAHKLRPPTK